MLPRPVVGARGPVGPLTGGVRQEVLLGACSLAVLELPLLPVLPGFSHSFADPCALAAQTCNSPPDGTDQQCGWRAA